LIFCFPSQFYGILIIWMMKDIGGVSSSHMMDDSVEKGGVDSQPKSDKFDQQTISPIQMDFATVDDVVKPAVDVEKEKVSDHTVQKVCNYIMVNS